MRGSRDTTTDGRGEGRIGVMSDTKSGICSDVHVWGPRMQQILRVPWRIAGAPNKDSRSNKENIQVREVPEGTKVGFGEEKLTERRAREIIPPTRTECSVTGVTMVSKTKIASYRRTCMDTRAWVAERAKETLETRVEDNRLAPRVCKAERAPCPNCGVELVKMNFAKHRWASHGLL